MDMFENFLRDDGASYPVDMQDFRSVLADMIEFYDRLIYDYKDLEVY